MYVWGVIFCHNKNISLGVVVVVVWVGFKQRYLYLPFIYIYESERRGSLYIYKDLNINMTAIDVVANEIYAAAAGRSLCAPPNWRDDDGDCKSRVLYACTPFGQLASAAHVGVEWALRAITAGGPHLLGRASCRSVGPTRRPRSGQRNCLRGGYRDDDDDVDRRRCLSNATALTPGPLFFNNRPKRRAPHSPTKYPKKWRPTSASCRSAIPQPRDP